MRVAVLLCAVLGVTITSADITGQHPASGTCLCLTGTNVHARSAGNLKDQRPYLKSLIFVMGYLFGHNWGFLMPESKT